MSFRLSCWWQKWGIFASLSGVVGLCLSASVQQGVIILLMLTLGSAMWLIFQHRYFWRSIVIVFVFAWSGLLWGSFFNRQADDALSHLQGRGVIVGRILGDWQSLGAGRWRVDLEVSQWQAQAVFGRARISLRSEQMPLGNIGDQLHLVGFLERPSLALNFGAFSYRDYLARQQIFSLFRAQSVLAVLPDSTWVFSRLLQELRRDLLRRFEQHLPLTAARILGSLILGEAVSPVPDEIKEQFQQVGLQHVLAVSGFQVQLVVLSILGTCAYFGFPRPLSVGVAGVALWGFVALTGCPASVLRAAAVASLGLLAYVCFRQVHAFKAFIYGCACLLVWNPVLWQDIGFQFSFLATLGLILSHSICQQALGFLPLPIGQAIGPILAAQLWVLPAQLYHFGSASWLFLPANLFSGMITTLLTWSAIIGAISGWLLPGLQAWILLPAGYMVQIFVQGVSLLLKLPQPLWLFPPLLLSMVLLIYTLLLIGPRLSPRLISASLASLVLIPGGWRLQESQTCPLRVTFLHVGQGDAILLESQGKTALIDAGPQWQTPQGLEDSGQHDILPYLQRRGIRHLDWVILSHPHLDHFGGLFSVIQTLPVGEFITVTGGHENTSYKRLLKQIQSRDIAMRNVSNGAIQTFGVARLVFWQPLPQAPDGNPNDQSLVLQVIHEQVRILLSGDLEAEGEAALLANSAFQPQHDILKVPHHGSDTSSTSSFLHAVKAQDAIISVGKHNRFGHPVPAVVRRYERNKVRVWRTDQHGAVCLCSQGKRYTLRTATGYSHVPE